MRLKQYLPGIFLLAFAYLWFNRKHKKPLQINIRSRRKKQKNLINKLSRVPKVKSTELVIIKKKNKNFVKNKMKGKWIANSMAIRMASNKMK